MEEKLYFEFGAKTGANFDQVLQFEDVMNMRAVEMLPREDFASRPQFGIE
jgi:hypothetical protein